MIFVGYPGIGKSTYAKGTLHKYRCCIDLESSNFHEDNKPEGWERTYVDVAKQLSNDGFDVFVSSHKGVVDLIWEEIPSSEVRAIVPSIKLKDEWVAKLKDRYLRSNSSFASSERYKRAFMRVKSNYNHDVNYIVNRFEKNVYVIDSMNYSLAEIVQEIKDPNYKYRYKKVFISIPFHGRTAKEVLDSDDWRDAVLNCKKRIGSEFEVIDSIVEDTDLTPIQYLAKSIEKLSYANIAYFAPGWEDSRGCRIEHQVATEYGIFRVESRIVNDDEEPVLEISERLSKAQQSNN